MVVSYWFFDSPLSFFTNNNNERAAWGPPSGILLHTLGVGFLIGIDIYDTVLVLRTQEAVNAFARPKISIGAELSIAAGPIGSGGAVDMGFKDKSPAWVYTKSKGLYAGIQLDGSVVIERSDENERFYGRKIKAAELIQGHVKRPMNTDALVVTIEIAEGTKGAWAEMMEDPVPTVTDNTISNIPYEQPMASSSRSPEPKRPVPPLPPRRLADMSHMSSQEDKYKPEAVTPPADNLPQYGDEKYETTGKLH